MESCVAPWGLFEVGMGVGMAARAFAPNAGILGLILSGGVLACLVGKQAAIHWDHLKRFELAA